MSKCSIRKQWIYKISAELATDPHGCTRTDRFKSGEAERLGSEEAREAQRSKEKIHCPDEISATEISPQYDSSYLRGRQGRRLTGQVGQAEIAEKIKLIISQKTG
jgi:hypothetical protein